MVQGPNQSRCVIFFFTNGAEGIPAPTAESESRLPVIVSVLQNEVLSRICGVFPELECLTGQCGECYYFSFKSKINFLNDMNFKIRTRVGLGIREQYELLF